MLKKLSTATIAALLSAAVTATLAGCVTGQTPTTTAERPASAAVTPAPAAEPTVEPPPAPVADEYSQVVDGVLYQGTQKAPVRIGTDVPGQPPAAEAGFVAAEGWEDYLVSTNKYAVTMSPGYSDQVGGANGGHFVGWYWKVFGLSRHGSVRELDNSGYQAGTYLPSREAALAGPYTVDGRALDRAEYILVPIDDRYVGIS